MIPEELREKRMALLGMARNKTHKTKTKEMVICDVCCIKLEKQYYEKKHLNSVRHQTFQAIHDEMEETKKAQEEEKKVEKKSRKK